MRIHHVINISMWTLNEEVQDTITFYECNTQLYRSVTNFVDKMLVEHLLYFLLQTIIIFKLKREMKLIVLVLIIDVDVCCVTVVSSKSARHH